jgi:hypothetical protein
MSSKYNFQHQYKCNRCNEIFKSDSYTIIINSIAEHRCFKFPNGINISCIFCDTSVSIIPNKMNNNFVEEFNSISVFIERHFCKEMKKIKDDREEEEEEKQLSKQLKEDYDVFIREN